MVCHQMVMLDTHAHYCDMLSVIRVSNSRVSADVRECAIRNCGLNNPDAVIGRWPVSIRETASVTLTELERARHRWSLYISQ